MRGISSHRHRSGILIAVVLVIVAHDLLMATGAHAAPQTNHAYDAHRTSHGREVTPHHTHPAPDSSDRQTPPSGAEAGDRQTLAALAAPVQTCAVVRWLAVPPDGQPVGASPAPATRPVPMAEVVSRAPDRPWREPTEPPGACRARLHVYRI